MRIVHLCPGTGNYYNGVGIRDHTMVQALRRVGHNVKFMPIFLPVITEEKEVDTSEIYLDFIHLYYYQKYALLKFMPEFIQRRFNIESMSRKATKLKETWTPAENLKFAMGLAINADNSPEYQFLVEEIKEFKTNVISITGAYSMGLAPYLKKHCPDTKIIVHFQGEHTLLEALDKDLGDKFIEHIRNCAESVDQVIFQSEFAKDYFADKWKLSLDNSRVIENGISMNLFKVQDKTPKKETIGHLSHLQKGKNLNALVDAFKLICEKFPQCQMKLGGGMNMKDLNETQDILSALKADDKYNMKIMPNLPLDKKLDFLKSLDVLIIAWHDNDDCDNSCLEAMASGIPVIAPAKGPYLEIQEKTGALCLFKAPKEIITLYNKIRTNNKFRKDISIKCRQGVMEHYTIERMVGDIQIVLDEK
ncbi:MAG: glycosyltransferase family 4 protein [Lentisphaeria bacterium]|nr:glycosyltransferase family 4 protein [Lentisphaeria bacterium]NQZ69852.1 glycosyltransferase family 4 protein [Lentisphaeria bacterium]